MCNWRPGQEMTIRKAKDDLIQKLGSEEELKTEFRLRSRSDCRQLDRNLELCGQVWAWLQWRSTHGIPCCSWRMWQLPNQWHDTIPYLAVWGTCLETLHPTNPVLKAVWKGSNSEIVIYEHFIWWSCSQVTNLPVKLPCRHNMPELNSSS